MPKISAAIVDLLRLLIASGRTRLIVTLCAITGLVAGIYFDQEHGVEYMYGLVIVAGIFIICKTIQDIFQK